MPLAPAALLLLAFSAAEAEPCDAACWARLCEGEVAALRAGTPADAARLTRGALGRLEAPVATPAGPFLPRLQLLRELEADLVAEQELAARKAAEEAAGTGDGARASSESETVAGQSAAARVRLLARGAAALASACAAARPLHAAAIGPDRERLAALLAREELAGARADEGALLRLLAAIVDWLGELLGGDEAFTAAQGGRAAFLALLGFLLVLALWTIGKRRAAARSSAATEPEDRGVPLEEPEHYRRLATEALERGQHRAAIRSLLLASLAALERAHLLRPGRARTNRECAADLGRRGATEPLRERFSELARRYDRAFYGLGTVGREEAEELRRLSDEVIRLASAPPAPRSPAGAPPPPATRAVPPGGPA